MKALIFLVAMAVALAVAPCHPLTYAAKYSGTCNDELTCRKIQEGKNREEIERLQLLYQSDTIAQAYKSTLESFYAIQLEEFEPYNLKKLSEKFDRFLKRRKKARNKKLRKCSHRQEQRDILDDFTHDILKFVDESVFGELLRWENYTQKQSSLIKSSFVNSGFNPQKYRKVMYLKNEEWVFRAYEEIGCFRADLEKTLDEVGDRHMEVDSGALKSMGRKYRRLIRGFTRHRSGTEDI